VNIGYRISQQLISNINIVIKKEINYIGYNDHGSELANGYTEFKYYRSLKVSFSGAATQSTVMMCSAHIS
jgi:hypothetical protein